MNGRCLQRWSFLIASWILLGASSRPAWSASDCKDDQVWSGTIGEVPIMMEFRSVWDDRPVGRYYYRQGIDDLFLAPDPDKNDWQEKDADGKLTGRLTVSCDEKTLTGTWTSPDGTKSSPIHAEPAKDYSKPRLDGMKVLYGPTRKVGPHRYEVVRVAGIGDVEGVRLLGDGAGIAKINQAQLERFRSQVIRTIDFAADGRQEETIRYSELAQSVLFWNRCFVVIETASNEYNGGSQSPLDTERLTLDVQTGEPEAVDAWLSTEYQDDIKRDSELGRALFNLYWAQRANEDPRCEDVIGFFGSGIWLGEKGLKFPNWSTAFFSDMACEDVVEVPYKRLKPFLSKVGLERLGACFPESKARAGSSHKP